LKVGVTELAEGASDDKLPDILQRRKKKENMVVLSETLKIERN